jgi:voltage-gated potassium channel
LNRRRPKWRDEASLKWYDQVSLVFWLPVSFIYLAITLVQLVGGVSYGPWLFWFDVGMSCLFLVDYVIRLFLAEDWRTFVRHVWNIADLVVILTPLAALRFSSDLTGVVRIVRVFRLFVIGRRVWDSKTSTRQGGQVKWMAIVATGALAVASLMVWSAETATTNPKANIETPWDALWWAVVTMFTVGYGEFYPVTPIGRVSAGVAMIAGIALFSWATASLASWFAETGNEKEAKEQRDKMWQELHNMTQELKQLQRLQATHDEGRWERQNSGTAPHRPADVASERAVGAAEPSSAWSVTVDCGEGEVAIEWRKTKSWRWISQSSRTAYDRWVSWSHSDVFWYGLSVLIYAGALTQACFATDAFWPAAGISIPLFGFALLLTRFRSWAGWVQWGLWLSLAVLLGAAVSWLWVSWALLLAGIGLIPIEMIAIRRWNPPDASSSAAPDAMTTVAAADEAQAAEE